MEAYIEQWLFLGVMNLIHWVQTLVEAFYITQKKNESIPLSKLKSFNIIPTQKITWNFCNFIS